MGPSDKKKVKVFWTKAYNDFIVYNQKNLN
jgi:hypothetical protein